MQPVAGDGPHDAACESVVVAVGLAAIALTECSAGRRRQNLLVLTECSAAHLVTAAMLAAADGGDRTVSIQQHQCKYQMIRDSNGAYPVTGAHFLFVAGANLVAVPKRKPESYAGKGYSEYNSLKVRTCYTSVAGCALKEQQLITRIE